MSGFNLQLNLMDLIDSHATRLGDKPVIRHKKKKLSYSELPASIEAIKGGIDYLNNSRVMIILPDGIGTTLLYLHLFLSKATVIPISTQATTLHIEKISGKIKPHFLVTNRILYKKHEKLLARFNCVVVDMPGDKIPQFKLIPAWNSNGAQRPEVAREISTDNDIRVVLFTSGSTGEPKGVCLSDYNLLAAASMMADFLDLGPDRHTLITLPSFDYYGFIQIFGHLMRGGECILGESAAFMGSLLKVIEEGQCTDLAIVPHSLRQIINVMENKSKRSLNELSVVTSSSDLLTEELVTRSFALNPDLTFFDIYGLTEAGRACYKKIRIDTPFSRSIGRPSNGVEISVDNPDDEAGEIVIKGPNVAKGYFSDIIDDRIDICAIDCVRTGDIGCLDDAGNIILIGRKDHMINLMGEKIHPSEIESLAMMVAGIEDAIAHPKEHADGRRFIRLDVVCADFDAEKESEILALVRNSLGRTFVPEEVVTVPMIERTELGSKAKRF